MSAFGRTYRVGRHLASTVRGMLPRDGEVVLVFVEPRRTLMPGGKTRTEIGFPGLIVPDHVDEPEAFAKGVADLLNVATTGERGWRSTRDFRRNGQGLNSWCWLKRRDDGSLRMALYDGLGWRVADTKGRTVVRSQATIERVFSAWRRVR